MFPNSPVSSNGVITVCLEIAAVENKIAVSPKSKRVFSIVFFLLIYYVI
jgi:hypothetical protein